MNSFTAPPPIPLPVLSGHLTREEAAAYLGRSVGTLGNWAAAGVGPPYVYSGNGRVLYPGAALAEYLQAWLVYSPRS
ncbi:helix-turn-helix domain-containing protein [Arthrobacter sp. H5]|uniref:helix-turn-helix domain-containing protein n=1 Tax=Arthrobacter sp. H5 TaxID=1267973 RepID=UPI001C1DF653